MQFRKEVVGLFILFFSLVIVGFGQGSSQASAKIQPEQKHLHPGSDFTFKITLNEPLPSGAYFQVRLSPLKVDQELPISSGEPANKERTEFTLHAKLPAGAIPGDWHIKVIYLFLSGTSWTNNTISTNEMPFVVEGPKIAVPTRGTAEFVEK